jgi:hypothetical protein
MHADKIDEILHDIDKAGFGLAFSMIPEDRKAAFTKATSLGYLDIDPGNNYCLSRIGQTIVNSGLSYREWEGQNSKTDGSSLLDNEVEPVSEAPAVAAHAIEIPAPEIEEKPAKKSWLSIFGLK